MAFCDPFSFGSENDLLPIWDDDLFPLEPLLQQDLEFWDLGNIPPPEPQNFVTPNSNFVQDYPFQQWEDPSKVVVDPTLQDDGCVDCIDTTITDSESVIQNLFSFPSDHIKPTTVEYETQVKSEIITDSEINSNDDCDAVSFDGGNPEIQHHQLTYVPTENFQVIKTEGRYRKDKRRWEDQTEEYHSNNYSEMDNESVSLDQMYIDGEDDPTGGFKLPASKSPIMEAMVVCALHGWGIDVVKNFRGTGNAPAEVIFKVNDFDRYYRISRTICSKQRPTDDLGSRVKSLRRWFVNFPKKKDRCENVPFLLVVKPHIAKKVNEIIERNTRMLGLTKRRRRQ